MMPSIERSHGLYTGVGPYFCGSGYEGATAELDATVAKAAELMAKTFGRDIEIRFNSDRRSGGAFLKNSRPGFAGNCQVGLNAGLYKDRDAIEAVWNKYDILSREYREAKDALPDRLVISAYVKASALKDQSLCDSPATANFEASAHPDFPSLESALAWLTENVDRSKIYD